MNLSSAQQILLAFIVVLCAASIDTLPQTNPNSEYELINPRVVAAAAAAATTPKPTVRTTPRPLPPGSSTFLFNKESNSWTKLNKNDPVPEDALLWNQANDKWLTQ